MSRQTRSIRLCPPGMSGEQCFYSQLAMFVRQHNSFTDPVALRNIGKRSSSIASAVVGDDNDYGEQHYDVDYPLDLTEFGLSQEMPSFDLTGSRKNSVTIDEIYKSGSILSNILKSPAFLNELEHILNTKDTDSKIENDSSLIQAKSKRQIICPPGMPRVACYDNALAFYIQLMRTMNHKRFV